MAVQIQLGLIRINPLFNVIFFFHKSKFADKMHCKNLNLSCLSGTMVKHSPIMAVPGLILSYRA